jgi:cytidine deaminase
MLKHHESEIIMVVAVTEKMEILPPCGRCRELMAQVNRINLKAKVIVGQKKITTLSELLPYYWVDAFR